jgi:hypothetical protein
MPREQILANGIHDAKEKTKEFFLRIEYEYGLVPYSIINDEMIDHGRHCNN